MNESVEDGVGHQASWPAELTLYICIVGDIVERLNSENRGGLCTKLKILACLARLNTTTVNDHCPELVVVEGETEERAEI